MRRWLVNKYTNSALERELISRDSEFVSFFDSLHVDDRRFVRSRISHYPRKIQGILINSYRNETTSLLANSGLRKITDYLNAKIPAVLLNYFDAGEQELRDVAKNMAEHCQNYEIRASRVYAVGCSNGSIRHITASSRFNTPQSGSQAPIKPVNGSIQVVSQQDVYQWSADFVNGKGLKAPEINTKQTLEGCIKRMQDKSWWLRRLRRLLNKSREEVMIYLNQVNRNKGIYCSDLTALNRQFQKQKQEEMLKSLTMTNELGEQFSLYDLSQVNVSNPVIRRNELMTRARGFEDMALELGHEGIFVTLTCPSKYHNAYSKSGQRNPRWQGLMPYEGQQYLCKTWSKIRSELARQNIHIYGLRIAEPQHDGTPHWHMMLFMEKCQIDNFTLIIKRYSLEEDGDEKGAEDNRCDFKLIDRKKGSATGYIAKYVCKNIDGKDLDKGVHGEDPIMAAQRVEAWASCWGIRQFQQIGGVSVTVWRELRRFRKPEAEKSVYEDESFMEIHKAADSGNWASYTKLMGGVFCIRKSQVLRPYYELVVNKITGLIKTSWFDGLITTKLKGIKYKGSQIITRIHTWQLGKAGTDFLPSLGVL
jgi:hypothetical protein